MQNDNQYFYSSLPKTYKLTPERDSNNFLFIGAAGFEDRCLAFLNSAKEYKFEFKYAICIKYKPYDNRNKRDAYKMSLKQAGINNVSLVTYDRMNPEIFCTKITKMFRDKCSTMHAIIDISGMSKFLIVILLNEVFKYLKTASIIYSEAQTYHPTEQEFEKLRAQPPTPGPDFLTSDIYKIITTNSLASVSMQGYPTAIISFPNFNSKEVMALINELSPETLIRIFGVPHKKSNLWRNRAIKYINKSSSEYVVKVDDYDLTTFDYLETLKKLEEIYRKYHYSHRIILSPIGSKYQTIACIIFRIMHPDIQLVYPVTKTFSDQYTDGIKDIWRTDFKDIPVLLKSLKKFRFSDLDSINIDTAPC